MTPIFWIFFAAALAYVIGCFFVIDHFARKLESLHKSEWTTTEPERARMNKVVAMGSYRRLR